MKVIQSGVDSLVVGFHIQSYLGIDDFQALADAKALAGAKMFDSHGKGIEWFGTEFIVKPRGASGYEFILVNDDVRVCVAREARGGKVMPEVFVTFSSQYLWAKGVTEAVALFKKWLSRWAVMVGEKVSRADLCQDLELDFPEIDIKREVVTYAKGKVDWVEGQHYVVGRRSSGYMFGSGDLVGRFYDKVLEVKKHQKEYVLDGLRANGWDGETGVSRAEFQCRRKFLKLMQVETVDDLIQRLPDIWRYCTHDWLRVCVPGSATNQARWTVREFWKLIMNSYSLFGQALGILKMKVKQVRYDHLLTGLRGYMVSAGASLSSGLGIEQAIFKLRSDLRAMWSDNELRSDILARQYSMANMEKPHTHLVDAAIRMGAIPVGV